MHFQTSGNLALLLQRFQNPWYVKFVSQLENTTKIYTSCHLNIFESSTLSPYLYEITVVP